MKCKNCGGECREVGCEAVCVFCGASFKTEFVNSVATSDRMEIGGADVFEKNINGILEIFCSGKKSKWSGSGYIVTNDGYAITNAHVAADEDGSACRNITVRISGEKISAKVVALADNCAGRGGGVDLGLLKLERMPRICAVLELGYSNELRPGEPVFVIGNSLGHGLCITSGIVSDKERRVNGKAPYIMTDCAVNGGNSGGPIFNQRGQVIGTIVSQGRDGKGNDAEGMNYAIPVNTVREFIDSVLK